MVKVEKREKEEMKKRKRTANREKRSEKLESKTRKRKGGKAERGIYYYIPITIKKYPCYILGTGI